jgi:purine-binding chemotaxis protein CheW
LSQSNTQQSPASKGRGQPKASSESPRQFLTFTLQGEVFALGILAIKEIIEYSSLTSVPMMPGYVRGVINLRGAVVPVLDLSIRFGRTPSPVTKRTCIVIVEIVTAGQAQDLGLVVDTVDSVLEISGADIEPPPSFGARIAASFIEGMGRVNDRFVILLNTDSMLAAEEAELLQGGISEISEI